MTESLLKNKIFIPTLPRQRVSRPRLIDIIEKNLNQQQHFGHYVILISASTGFGKSTLAAQWVFRCREKGLPSAWFSLDEKDNRPGRFMTYFIAALQSVFPEIGQEEMDRIASDKPVEMESLFTTLINEISLSETPFLFVIDDYQMIESEEVNRGMEFLLEHLPPQMHLVMTTREDPNLPLSRWRAKGMLLELRASDLRFSLEEASEFFSRITELDLSQENINSLEARTEGWIAGLQLAALSIKGSSDPEAFIQAFNGSHRFVLDYLIDEVLNKQTGNRKKFLLQTSILKTLCPSLCDALTGLDDSRKQLAALERSNLFLIPLDDVRQWYRYHHLFADVLLIRLTEEEPQLIPVLHRRASIWFEENGKLEDAVSHAVSAGDQDRVAGLAAKLYESMDARFELGPWRTWVEGLPEETIGKNPQLMLQFSMTLSDSGDIEACEYWLNRLESLNQESLQAIEPLPKKDFIDSLPGKIANIRAGNAQHSGDISKMIRFSELALSLLPVDDVFNRVQAAVTLGMTHWACGNMAAARQAMEDWIEEMWKRGKNFFALASTFALCDILSEEGQVQDAIRRYRQAIGLLSEQDESIKNMASYLHLGLAMLLYQTGMEEAAVHFAKAREFSKYNTLPGYQERWHRAQASINEGKEEWDMAIYHIEEAQRLYEINPMPAIKPFSAVIAGLNLRRGWLNKAQEWADRFQLTPKNEPSYLEEYQWIIYIRILIAQYEESRREEIIERAFLLLDKLEKKAEEQLRNRSLIEIRILKSIAYWLFGKRNQGVETLRHTLFLSEPQAYIRIFTDEGSTLREVLSELLTKDPGLSYARKLISFKNTATIPEEQALSEPLSKREKEVLRTLNSDLSGPEIAENLCISLNTLRTHTKSIYTKLGSNSRRSAVRRARELGLLS